MNKINKNVCRMDISGNSGQCAEKEIAMERAGEVWSYPQAKAVSSAALAARVVELENDLSSHLHHAQAAQPFTLSDGMALCLDERVQDALADFGSRRSAMSAARLAYAVMTAHGQGLPASPSAPEPCVDPAACDRQGCANPRGRCEEAAPAIQVQESAALDEQAVAGWLHQLPPGSFFGDTEHSPTRQLLLSETEAVMEREIHGGAITPLYAALAAPAPAQPATQQGDAIVDTLIRAGETPEDAARMAAHGRAIAQRAGSREAKPVAWKYQYIDGGEWHITLNEEWAKCPYVEVVIPLFVQPENERDALVPSLKLSQVVEAHPSGCHSVQLIMASAKEAKSFCDSVNAAISAKQGKSAVKS